MLPPTVRTVALFATIAVGYFLAGKLGLQLAFFHGSASPIWPPTGIAIAAAVLLGPRAAAAIWLGAFVVNITNEGTRGSVLVSAGIATGNTLEGILAGLLVGRFATGREAFLRPADVFRFALLAGLASTLVSATVGVVSLGLGRHAEWARVPIIWFTWWLGDLGGAVIVAPALILWISDHVVRWRGWRLAELGLLLFTVVLVTELVFGGIWPSVGASYPLKFLCVPPLLWAAFRFGPRETATAAVLLSVLAIRGALADWGSSTTPSANDSLLVLQSFLAVTTLTMLAVAASVRTRKETAKSLRQLNDDLERVVAARTAELDARNRDLSQEVAERSRAEARLLEAQRLAHIGSWEWDVGRNEVWWSDELYRIYGLDPQTFAGSYQGFLDRVHHDDRERVDRIIRQASADHRPFAFEHRIVRPDGSERTLSAEGNVIVDAAGKLVSMVGTGQDVTERKQAEEQRHVLLQAKEANRLKEEFLAVLSHELRTPLNAILGWACLLRDGRLDVPTAGRAVETIVRNARLQDKLIADLLDVSRIMSGRIEVELRVVDARHLVETVVDTLRVEARARAIELVVRSPALLPPLQADGERLSQVVTNIVANALRFARTRIGIALSATDRELSIEVQDDGPGIPPAFLPYLFDRFRQADASTTRRHGGLGLGLAIARHLVELHGGSIGAANRTDGTGAVLTVKLPLAPVEQAPRAVSTPASAPPVVQLEGLQMLVVDDDQDGREATCTLLRQWGARASSVGSVRETLAAVQRQVPDIVLADIGMPEEDGYSLLQQLRALDPQQGGQVPVAALTAYAGAEHRQRLLAAGFLAHLTKPLRPDELAALLLERLRARRSPTA